MDAAHSIKITIVNRYYPPDRSVTAEAASDLAKHLIKEGFTVSIVCAEANYQGGGASGQGLGKIYRIPGMYEGKHKLRRLYSSVMESKKLIRTCLKTDPDLVIVMTSPPLLNYYASKIFKSKKIPWIYWSLDLFPEAFHANGLIAKHNPIYRYTLKKAYSYAPVAMLALGKLQADYLTKQFNKQIPVFILPCGVFIHNGKQELSASDRPIWKADNDKIYLGYIGNLGEAHSEEFLMALINNLDPKKFRLVLVLYGSKAEKVLKQVSKDNEALILMDHLPRHELSHIDIHLASLKSEWVHICVPSKLVSAVHRGSCFLFYGPKDSDSWQYLKEAGWLIEEKQNFEKQLLEFMESLDKEMIRSRHQAAIQKSTGIASDVLKAYDELSEFIKKRKF